VEIDFLEEPTYSATPTTKMNISQCSQQSHENSRW
jgi:hypothetical protein